MSNTAAKQSSAATLDLGQPEPLQTDPLSPAGEGAAALRFAPGQSPARSTPATQCVGKRMLAPFGADDAALHTPASRRVSARRSLRHASAPGGAAEEEQAATVSAASRAVPVGDDVDASAPTSASSSQGGGALLTTGKGLRQRAPGAAADVEPPSPDHRKIWMRPCNECGHELHVRRTKCTECGSIQTSKRTMLQAKEDKSKADERAYEEAQVREEEQEAASQLALIIEASSPERAASMKRASARASKTTASSPAAARKAAALAASLKRLSPEQLAKLRRMHKLRALLSKLPPGVTLPAKPSLGGQPASSVDADAIAMLASVACM